jgi:methylmalonyl-CoA mutase cobalamin-binding subunit
MSYNVLLAGVGDDAHSIGLALIKIALEKNDYNVASFCMRNSSG